MISSFGVEAWLDELMGGVPEEIPDYALANTRSGGRGRAKLTL
jgi:hypothetical protein